MLRKTSITIACIGLLGVSLAAQADRHFGHWGGRHYWGGPHYGSRSSLILDVGPLWWPGYWPYYYTPPVVAPPPATTTYVQPAPQDSSSYWYYCESPKGYYPYVKSCPGGWMQVVPSTP